MFTHKHYVPILKAKKAELRALKELSTGVAEMITPLLEIIAPELDLETGRPKKSLPEHFRKVAEGIVSHWGVYAPFFLDPGLLGLKTPKRKKEKHPLELLFEEMRVRALKAIPVTGVIRESAFQQAVAKVLQEDQRGFSLRLRRDDFMASDRDALIEDTLKVLDCPRSETDLLIDFGPVTEKGKADVLMDFVNLTKSLPELTSWRTFTLAASSFPAQLPGDKAPVQCKLTRIEWLLWSLLAKTDSSFRKPAFADYGVFHPVPLDFKFRKMNASRANLRYTTDDAWMILRSRSVPTLGKGLGDPMLMGGLALHQNLCRDLVAMPQVFCGGNFSKGDECIELSASGPKCNRDSSTWLYVGMNHHLTKVSRQIAMLA